MTLYTFVGDLHLGHNNSNRKEFRRVLRKSEKVFLMGDMIEGITKKDKRHSNNDCNLTVDEQIIELINDIRPHKNKIMGYCIGNHEQTVHSILDIDVAGIICKTLKIHGFYTQTFKVEKGITFFITHGSGSAATYQGAVTKLINFSKDHSAHYYFMGHTHKLFDIQISKNPNPYIIVNTGTLSGESEYALKRGYPNPILGYYTFDTETRILNKVVIK